MERVYLEVSISENIFPRVLAPVEPYPLHTVTITCFYFAIGVALMLGAGSLVATFADTLDRSMTLSLQLAIGSGLIAVAAYFWIKRKLQGSADRTERWRTRVANRSSTVASLMGLALLAGVLELTMMLPYLGAIGILTTSDIGWPSRVLMLAAYTLIMIVPAVVLFAVRILGHDQIDPRLERLSKRIAKEIDEATVWVPAAVGFLVAAGAATDLGWV
ncbi:GAP family protein [Natrinema soli]|uniref:GAP family protein n=1 Tax=Natrinema soli TaxID=1930624 RepID=A0ABD5SPH6_9EURY|nr:GAP family protein [Natrinema soli]